MLGLALTPAYAQFGPVTQYPRGAVAYCWAMTLADINGDGQLDAVMGSGDKIDVLLGQAGGSFTASATYQESSLTPIGVALGDVTGDGQLDVVTSCHPSTGGVVTVRPGLAGGTFGNATLYPTGTPTAARVALHDLNNDGRLDIVASYLRGGVYMGIMMGLAGGSFSPIRTYGTNSFESHSMTLANLNGDGQIDLVQAGFTNDLVSVRLGQSGGFRADVVYSAGTGGRIRAEAVGDVNGDGQPDIVVVDGNTHQVGVLLGQATGGFAAGVPYSCGAGSTPNGVALGDVNGDGRLDIITANSGTQSVGVLLGQAGGGFAPVITHTTGTNTQPIYLKLADVNGDGRLDIVTVNMPSIFLTQTATISVLLNQMGLAVTAALPAVGLTVAPNPATGRATVQLPAALGASKATLTVLDALSRPVHRQLLAGGVGSVELPLAGYAPGIYQVQVLSANGQQFRQRLIIE